MKKSLRIVSALLALLLLALAGCSGKSEVVVGPPPAAEEPVADYTVPDTSPATDDLPARDEPDIEPVVTSKYSDDDVKELYSFCENRMYGLLNQSAKVIVDPIYEELGDPNLDYIPAKKGGAWGLIDRKGNEVTEFRYQAIKSEVGHKSGDGYFAVQQNNKWGLFNPANGKAVDCKYDEIGEMSGGVFPAKLNGFWGVVNASGATVAEFIYDDVSGGPAVGKMFTHRMLGVCFNQNWGAIDDKGNYVVTLGSLPYMATEMGIIDEKFIEFRGSDMYFTNSMIYLTESRSFLEYPFVEGAEPTRAAIWDCILYANDTLYFNYYLSRGAFSSIPLNALAIRMDGSIVSNYLQVLQVDKSQSFRGNIYHENPSMILLTNSPTIGSAGEFNLVLRNGSCLVQGHARKIGVSRQYVFASQNGSSTLYDYDGNPLQEVPEEYDLMTDFALYRYKERYDRAAVFYFFGTGETIEYEIAERTSNQNAFIVSDGIFYGLLAGDKLVGSGMSYQTVRYNEDSQIFSLSLGANTEQYRVGLDGTIVKL